MTETIDLESRRAALETTQRNLKAAQGNRDAIRAIDDASPQEREQAEAEVQRLEGMVKRQQESIQRIEAEQHAEAEREKEARIREVFDEGVTRNRKAALPLAPQLDRAAVHLGETVRRVLALFHQAHYAVGRFVGPEAALGFDFDDLELIKVLIARICVAAGIEPSELGRITSHAWDTAHNAPTASKLLEHAFNLLDSRRPSDDPAPVVKFVEPGEQFTGPIDPI